MQWLPRALPHLTNAHLFAVWLRPIAAVALTLMTAFMMRAFFGFLMGLAAGASKMSFREFVRQYRAENAVLTTFAAIGAAIGTVLTHTGRAFKLLRTKFGRIAAERS